MMINDVSSRSQDENHADITIRELDNCTLPNMHQANEATAENKKSKRQLMTCESPKGWCVMNCFMKTPRMNQI